MRNNVLTNILGNSGTLQNFIGFAKIDCKAAINMLADLVTGDGKNVKEFSADEGVGVKYNSGPDLVQIFNELGFSGVYGKEFPARWYYAQERLTTLNEKGQIDKFLKYFLHPQNLLGLEEGVQNKIYDIVNRYLVHDGFCVKSTETDIIIEKLDGSLVKTEKIQKVNNQFIIENATKCEDRIKSGDFSGDITSAHSLLESVLKYVYKDIFSVNPENLNLPDLYKEVVKKLNIHATSNLDNGLKKVAGGLNTCVVSISEIRNKSSDGHGGSELKYRVEEHHALLVVNAAKTIAQFLFESHKKQMK